MQMEVVDVVGQGIRGLEELGSFLPIMSAIVYTKNALYML